jgi:hypothetical protein
MTFLACPPHAGQPGVRLVDDQLDPAGGRSAAEVALALAEAVVGESVLEVRGEVADLVVCQ